jgi:uncharacterized protein (DUF2267 family)
MKQEHFVHKVAQRAGCSERRAEVLTFAVFQELRDRLTPKQVAHVAAQLAAPLKILWTSFDRPNREVRRIHEAEFIDEVRRMAALPNDGEAQEAVRAVFRTLQESLAGPNGLGGEAWDVFSQLPRDLKRLWLAAAD